MSKPPASSKLLFVSSRAARTLLATRSVQAAMKDDPSKASEARKSPQPALGTTGVATAVALAPIGAPVDASTKREFNVDADCQLVKNWLPSLTILGLRALPFDQVASDVSPTSAPCERRRRALTPVRVVHMTMKVR